MSNSQMITLSKIYKLIHWTRKNNNLKANLWKLIPGKVLRVSINNNLNFKGNSF